MTKNIWEAFDTNNDMEGFKEEVKEASAGSGDFTPLPHGKYEVALENLELKPTKETNKPMMVFTFKVIEGEHAGRLIWYNQVVAIPKTMSIGLRFLNDMALEPIEFESMSKLAEDMENALGPIQENREFVLDFYKNKNDYDAYKIEQVFDLE